MHQSVAFSSINVVLEGQEDGGGRGVRRNLVGKPNEVNIIKTSFGCFPTLWCM